MLGARRDGELAALVVPVCRQAGVRALVTGDDAGLAELADGVVPGGERLPTTAREVQADGVGVLPVAAYPTALGHADVGVGVHTGGQRPPWGAHVLAGDDVEARRWWGRPSARQPR